MKIEPSNNNLILIAAVAIGLSIFSIFLSMGKLGITGASTEYGYVNVTIGKAVDITVVRAQINFTDAAITQTRTSDDSGDVQDCTTDFECGINITNVGNTEVNITLANSKDLWESPNNYTATHYLYNVTMDPSYIGANEGLHNCSTGYDLGLPLTGGWRAMPIGSDTELAICRMNYTGSSFNFWGQVDINITVPSDESPGEKSSTITFSASDANP